MEVSPPNPRGDLEGAVYEQLRLIALRQMQNERAGHTLTATALVHEAYVRLRPGAGEEGAQFYHAAARAMRRILIDHARRRGAVKRGGGGERARVEIQSVLDLAREEDLDRVLALDEAVLRLESEDEEAASVVRLRFYAGLTGERTAELLGISARQVDRAWAFARAFLARAMREGLG